MIFAGPYLFVQHLHYTSSHRIYAIPGGGKATMQQIHNWARDNKLPFEVVG